MQRNYILILVLSICIVQQLNAQQNFTLGVTENLSSTILNEVRTLNIYLPAYYADTIEYPVIYLLDGSADEDFIHVSGIMQFMNMMSIIPDAIIVGIANIDRKRDFCFPTTIEQDKIDFPTTGGSENFIAFIEKELQPYIENKYRTTTSKTIIGQSLGGLVATEILYKNPTLFTNYIIVSPSLWWDNESLLKLSAQAIKNLPKADMQVYIAVGDEHPIMEKDAKTLFKTLKKSGKLNLSVYFEHLTKEDHATILHSSIYNAFKLLFGTK